MNRLVIIGAGGHGRVAADIAERIGYDEIIFLDDADIEGVAGKSSDYIRYISDSDFFIAIGSSRTRRKLHFELCENGCNVVTLIHPTSVIAKDVRIGKGSIVAAAAVINPGAVIGESVIINTSSSVDHDCKVGDFCHISVGAHLAGTVNLGEDSMIGAGATVINNIDICSGCTIGAGAVVVKNIDKEGTYIGVPARIKL